MLKNLLESKRIVEEKFSLGKFVSDLNCYIDANFSKPRDEVISDYLGKKIDFDEFISKVKPISKKYHYYSMIRDKLSHIANSEQQEDMNTMMNKI